MKYVLVFIMVMLTLGGMTWALNNYGYTDINVEFEDDRAHIVLFVAVQGDEMFYLFPGLSGKKNDSKKVFVPSSYNILEVKSGAKKMITVYILDKGAHKASHFIKVRKNGDVEINVVKK